MLNPTRRTPYVAAALLLALAACGDRKEGGDADATPAVTPGTAAAPATTGVTDADDAEDRVEEALETDAALRGFDLDADDDDNAVVLKGTVQTAAQKTQAEQIAMRVAPGVTVRNELRVDASAAPRAAGGVDADDAADRVEDALDDDATLGPLDLDVDDDDGRVVLKGNVRTAEQKAQAEQIARRVAASVPVVSELRVQ